MRSGSINLTVDYIRVDDGSVVTDDEIAQHFDFSGGLVDLDHSRVSAGGKRELRAHEAFRVRNDVGLGMGKGVVVRRLQAGFHIVRNQMLIVVSNPSEFGEAHLLYC